MLDIHTHILPGLDDGATDMFEAISLARAAAEEGITDIIATPHHANGTYSNKAADIVNEVFKLNKRLQKEGIPLTVHPGQEIRVHDDLIDAWHRGELLTLAGSSYILLEIPGSSIPNSIYETIHELNVLGLKPVIAHPERNLEIIKNPNSLHEMIELGCYAQVTTHSLLGSFGGQVQKCAWTLSRKGWIHLVSSDAHHLTRRGFRLLEAYTRIDAEQGQDDVLLYQNNARMLLTDSDLKEKTGEKTSALRGLLKKLLK